MKQAEAQSIIVEIVKKHSEDFVLEPIRRRRKAAANYELIFLLTLAEGDNSGLYEELGKLCFGSDTKNIIVLGSDVVITEDENRVEVIMISAVCEVA